jgi:hypothetical protein
MFCQQDILNASLGSWEAAVPALSSRRWRSGSGQKQQDPGNGPLRPQEPAAGYAPSYQAAKDTATGDET